MVHPTSTVADPVVKKDRLVATVGLGTRPQRANHLPSLVGRRVWLTQRHLQMVLGLLWLADGLLQLQPYMFSMSFFNDALGMSDMGLPYPLAVTNHALVQMLGPHPAMWNAVFAGIQIAIGVALLATRVRTRWVLGISVIWSLGVWFVGEGLGGIFMPSMNTLAGAPGAVVLYSVAALLLWPHTVGEGPAIADTGVLGPDGARMAWAVIWVGSALLWFEHSNWAPGALAAQVQALGNGEPAFLAHLDQAMAHALTSRGTLVALGLIGAQTAVGMWVLRPPLRRLALVAGMLLAGIYWVVGQNLGQVLTGRGTDPGSGPVLVLIAFALWPRSRFTAGAVPTRQKFRREPGARARPGEGGAPEMAITGALPGPEARGAAMAASPNPASPANPSLANPTLPANAATTGVRAAEIQPARVGRRPRWLWLGAGVAVLTALTAVVHAWPAAQSASAMLSGPAGARAPAFSLSDVRHPGTGSLLGPGTFAGRPLVINFWASWCTECEQEAPALQAANRELGGTVQMLGVDVNDSAGQATAFMHRFGVTYPSAFDPGGQVARLYSLVGVPTTVFVSTRGRLLGRHLGALTEPQLVSIVARLYKQ